MGTESNNQGGSSGPQKWEDRILIVRRYFEKKGYRVHSGLQFGCELVLYADDPAKVHSDFCVHVVPEGQCAFLIGRFLEKAICCVVSSCTIRKR
jgi:tRNA splicing endonuclease